ncbi:hypothetical protein DI005_05720 [Prauserella sp. PE36]|uniref:Uncharacterized protein n=1 Tax=Prauserella endophytica TaxID=1592324 RepID=A0ABY2S7H0_9PSEU|nr:MULTISPECIES: hypothetical protein [Prauserella]PXY30473.1 hypothetical protein BAY59_13275 [Prauserella coralliicola]RBM22723.1 hypothetical protein DI005_05720 [Prauserella sp. PE36]TKG71249.1 hypothetical protein FCN18_14185 [Prauserella endophytica]
MCCPSATLAVWSSAWLHGAAASDNALDALLAWGEAHEVVAAEQSVADVFDLPVTGDFPATPVQLFTALRKLGATDARLVLPVPGDVRGLGGGGPFTEAALRAGEAVVFPGLGYGLVPHVIAEGLVRWTVYPVATESPLGHLGIADAEHGLTDAIRDSAGALQSLDVASDRPGVRAELSAKLRSRPAPDWPPGTPGRALRVLQRTEEIGAILALANADEPGGALSASAATRRADALRPLSEAVRTARCAAVNEAVRVFADQANRS